MKINYKKLKNNKVIIITMNELNNNILKQIQNCI